MSFQARQCEANGIPSLRGCGLRQPVSVENFGDVKVGVGADGIFRCLENTVWLALKALQSPLL